MICITLKVSFLINLDRNLVKKNHFWHYKVKLSYVKHGCQIDR